VLLVFLLTFVVIMLFQAVFRKYAPTPPQPALSETHRPPPTSAAAGSPPQAAGQATTPAKITGIKQASAEAETVIENDLYRITFTNRGAQVKSWILKKFDDDHARPLELVNRPAAERYGFPLSLWTYDENQRNKINAVLYVASASGRLGAPATLSFEYAMRTSRCARCFALTIRIWSRSKPPS